MAPSAPALEVEDTPEALLEARYRKFRGMGRLGREFLETS